jgi:hypothetical protein
MKDTPTGFKTFNKDFKHQFVLCQDENETISIKTKSGKRITISVMEGAGCIDIKYFDSPLPKIDNRASGLEQFTIMGFNEGKTPVKSTALTLLTILTNR